MTKSGSTPLDQSGILLEEGDIHIASGLVLETERVTIEFASGTSIDTVDAQGQDILSDSGELFVEIDLPTPIEQEIVSDATIIEEQVDVPSALSTAFAIGESDTHMMFSKPVKVSVDVDPNLE